MPATATIRIISEAYFLTAKKMRLTILIKKRAQRSRSDVLEHSIGASSFWEGDQNIDKRLENDIIVSDSHRTNIGVGQYY